MCASTQARTLDFYRQVGLTDAAADNGGRVLAANLWVAGEKAIPAVRARFGKRVSAHPYALMYLQDELNGY
jgi:hypothetical protein